MFVQDTTESVSHEELKTLVGAGGIIPAVTKDCPETISGVSMSGWTKSCELSY
ncbi:type A2 lanthipeptide [Staphylococcus chromogenes]|uniref:type A2 lanthipeptide n=1 Tax=Staphylococcus chromogenes TaxID=46126 RepID=UPI0028864657|nr:type A2 lanthipeptide [Staphylococcus chromogenes]MDT0700870.1 type A2 lanthipeptide [Staphylococcus chromogenes]